MQGLIFETSADVILCQETKLDPSVYSSELFPDNFTVFRKDRDSHGGGVCIAVNNKIQANQCHDLENSSEALWVKLITSAHQPLYICFYYRPPDKTVDYLCLLRDQLEILSSQYHAKSPLIIVSGDFNILHINWDNNTAATCS